MCAEFYGLATPPFQLTPDARFFFESTVHRRAMAYMVYGLGHAEGFIIITGEIGAGKTILVNNLLSTIDENSFVTAKIVSSHLGGDDLLYLVAAGFGIAREGLAKGSLLQRINDFVLAQHRSGKRALLIVDEAQNLTFEALEELRMLSNIVVDGTTTFQSLLLGQPQFRTMLGSPGLEQLRQRITAAYHLGPLNEAETKAYIEHRLRRADWKGNPYFTEASFRLIYLHTQGVPRRINTLCSRLLLHGSLEQLHTLTPSAVDKVANDLREEIAGVASVLAPVPRAEKSVMGEALRRPKPSLAPSNASPPENALPPVSLPWWKIWRKPTETVLVRGSAFFTIATLLLAIIAATQNYILVITAASTRKVAEATQTAVDTAKPTLVEIPPLLQSIVNQDRLSSEPADAGPGNRDQMPGEKSAIYRPNVPPAAPPAQSRPVPQEAPAHATPTPAEDYTRLQSVSQADVRDPARPARALSPPDVPSPVIDTIEQQAATFTAQSSATQSAQLPEPPLVASPTLDPQQGGPKAASPAASPPPVQSSANSGLSPTEIAALVVRGDGFLSAGDIASARLFYERAADAGNGSAALRLGASYDPGFLSRADIRGISGDPRQAASWYLRARELGDAAAIGRLRDLDQWRAAEPKSSPR